MLALGEEIAAQAIVGSIVWALRRNKEPRSREMISSATRFIAYAPNFPFFFSPILHRASMLWPDILIDQSRDHTWCFRSEMVTTRPSTGRDSHKWVKIGV